MTYEQTREQFLLAWNSNAYLNMCESDDMHNAIVALEKQIPKKVTKSACPSCNRIFLFRHSEKRKGDYCDNCGQALDWSDNNARNII